MHRRRAGSVALLMFVLWSGHSLPLHAGTVFVLSQTSARLTAIDTETNQVGATIDVPKGPAHFIVAPDGKRAYVAHSDRGEISVIDLANRKILQSFKSPGAPFGLALGPTGTLYVGDWNSDQIHQLDANTGAVLRSATAGKAPAHLSVTSDGKLLVAAAREADQIAIFDTATLEDRTTIPVGRAPFALTTSHDGRTAAVANAQAGTVSQIELKTRKVISTLRVGAMPYGVAYTPNDTAILVTNQQSGTVSKLSGADPLPALKVGSYPEGVAISPDGVRAYVANWFSDDVSVVDVASGSEITRIKVPGGPRAVAIVPPGDAP